MIITIIIIQLYKQNLYCKIGIEIDEEGLKVKLRSYRDVYRRERAKVLASEDGTGKSADELYVSKVV